MGAEVEPAGPSAAAVVPAADALVVSATRRRGTLDGVGAVLRAAPLGMRVSAAQALQRAYGNRRFGRMLARVTPGEVAVNTARTWLDADASVKVETDVLRVALRDIKASKSVAFNRDAGKTRLAAALAILGKTGDRAAVEADWTWLVDNQSSIGTPTYVAKERAFFGHFQTPLAALSAAHPGARTTYWLKNTPPVVMDAVIAASDASVPPDELYPYAYLGGLKLDASVPPAQLYAYAYVEGLDDYVRDEIGLGKKDGDPTMAQLTSVGTTNAVSGFGHLGIDDFWLDLHAKSQPLSVYLPVGYDLSVLRHQSAWNEEEPKRLVDSAVFPNLAMGLQALAASIKRRRALFLADVKALGYAAPTTDELIYWTYIYSSAGANAGHGQLSKYQGRRNLSDWITKGEYPNAIALLQSYRMIEKMALF
jgi:hypothetical protein